MPTLKVIVNKLNKRKDPVTDLADTGNVVGQVFRDFSFEGTEERNSLGKWYRDRDGNAYWGEGVVEEFTPSIHDDAYAGKISWAHTKFGITDIWSLSGCRGENIKVAILDTGIDEQCTEFTHIIAKKNFTTTDANAVQDTDGHGTEMAGIVAASGVAVYGVAPGAGLLIAKVDVDINDSLVNGVRWARENKADIISMSFECDDADNIFSDELSACKKEGIALIAAAGNGGHNNTIKNKYPASYNSCYSIGACDSDLVRLNSSNMSAFLRMLSPGKHVLTTALNGASALSSETSIAAAYTSGVTALLLSVLRKKDPHANSVTVMESLLHHTTILPSMSDKNAYGEGVINPYKTFSQL